MFWLRCFKSIFSCAHPVGLRGTEFNSKISTHLRTILILHFLKFSFWKLKERAAKKANAPMAGYGYTHPGARPSSKPLTVHHDTRVRFNPWPPTSCHPQFRAGWGFPGTSSVERVTLSSEDFVVWVVEVASSEAEGSSETASSPGLGCDHSVRVKSLLLVLKPGCFCPLVEYFTFYQARGASLIPGN